MKSDKTAQILQLAKQQGVLRPRDLIVNGIPRIYLKRMVDSGLLEKAGRGLYVLAGSQPTGNHTLVQVTKRIPGGIVCLLSALQFHGLTSQQPSVVWLALDRKAWHPEVPELPVRFVWFSKGPALDEGVAIHTIEGVPVKVYNIPKTVADCFKYRNKIGLDVALEALRECRRQKRCSMDNLWKYAQICRVANIMRPYLEAIG